MPKPLPPAKWIEIKTRFIVNGETPKDIAKDYDITAKSISDKAAKEDWVNQRKKSQEDSLQSAINKREAIAAAYLKEIETAVNLVITERSNGSTGAYIQDGEGFPNKYVEHAYKAGLDIAKGNDQNINLTGDLMRPVEITFKTKDE